MLDLSNISTKNLFVYGGLGAACLILIIAYSIGVRAGVEHERLESKKVKEKILEELRVVEGSRDALSVELTKCEAQKSADCALNCEVVCAEDVSEALKNAQAWACED